MTYRSIFVHVDDSDQTDLRLDAATRLARHYPAEVAGAYIVSTRDFTPTESALLPPELVKARMGSVAQAQRDAEKRFRAAVAAAGVKSLQWRAPAGPTPSRPRSRARRKTPRRVPCAPAGR